MSRKWYVILTFILLSFLASTPSTSGSWSWTLLWGVVIGVPFTGVAFIWALRSFSRSKLCMKMYDMGGVKMVPCEDCSGGMQLLGEKIPKSMHLESGMDEYGPFFQSRQANAHPCNTCQGLGRIPKRVS